MSSDKITSRQRIIDAAINISINQGPKTLTLDKVASDCAMSKGGVMHYFKNKEMQLNELNCIILSKFARQHLLWIKRDP